MTSRERVLAAFAHEEPDLGEKGSAFRRHLGGGGGGASASAGGYTRALNLDTATHETQYTRGGTNYRRTYFSSRPANVMVMRLSADRAGAYSGRIVLADAHKAKVTADGNTITASGALDGYVYGGGSTRGRKKPYTIVLDYEAKLVVMNEGGTIKAGDGGIDFEGCDSLTLFLAAGTNYLNRRDRGWKRDHPRERGSRFVERILTVATTCRQQGRSVLEYLVAACEAHARGGPAPSLLPVGALSAAA